MECIAKQGIDHWQKKEIVRTSDFPIPEHLQNIASCNRETHHLRQVYPARRRFPQVQRVTQDVVPSFEYPKRNILLPVLRRVFRRIKETNAVCLRIDDLNACVSCS